MKIFYLFSLSVIQGLTGTNSFGQRGGHNTRSLTVLSHRIFGGHFDVRINLRIVTNNVQSVRERERESKREIEKERERRQEVNFRKKISVENK